MNILLTSAGRRGYIVEYFKEALGKGGKVYVGNSNLRSAAFGYADVYVVTPLIYDSEYIPFLLEYCKKEEITVIIPLFDIDLLVLAKNRELFEMQGISVVVSKESVINVCNDKWNTYKFCKKNNILTAKTYLDIRNAEKDIMSKNLTFPVFIKPRWGMGSLAIYEADKLEEMKSLYNRCKKDIYNTYLRYEAMLDMENPIIIQEKLSGQEYGMDVINDLEGNFCCNVVRKKYEMRAGETDCASVIKLPEMDLISRRISSLLRHIGNLDVDLFVKKNKIYLLEMNARFGGGYPFSHLAGVDLPKAIIKWINKENLKNELVIKKYNRIVQKDIQFIDLSKIIEE